MLVFSNCIELFLLFILLGLFFALIKFSGYYDERKRHVLLAEILDRIQKHYDPKDVERVKDIIRTEPSIVNYVHDKQGNTPFLKACELGATNVVKEMINNGADINYRNFDGNGAVYFATYYLVKHPYCKNASCIRALFYSGANINAKNNKGYTPLHLAAYHGHIPLIRWLLEKGADTEMEPLPAGLALANGNKSAACILIKGQDNKEVKKKVCN